LPRCEFVAGADGNAGQSTGHYQEAKPHLGGVIYQFNGLSHWFNIFL
jgi:hypothetical protein